ncbi:MAG: hypothetical protein M3N23_05205 [Pseudomonadota bacterium]|nr:hypothetical protein [Pseudomonadota bacterium]
MLGGTIASHQPSNDAMRIDIVDNEKLLAHRRKREIERDREKRAIKSNLLRRMGSDRPYFGERRRESERQAIA